MYFQPKFVPILAISVLYLIFPNVESSNNTSEHSTAKINLNQTSTSSSFDCINYTSCTACVSSSSPCDWCLDGNRCTHDTSQNCRNDILVTGVNRESPSYRKGPSFCPKINDTSSGSSEILIPASTKKSIRVKVDIIGQFIAQTRLLCQVNIEERVTSLNAQLLGDVVYCDGMEFGYNQNAPNITAAFNVIWGGSKPLDNPNDVHIVVYKCHDMAKSNDECLVVEAKYGCEWCNNTNSCEYSSQCSVNQGNK